MTDYKTELRQNRHARATGIVRRALGDTTVASPDIDPRLLRDLSLIQNRTRGEVFELLSEVIADAALDPGPILGQQTFATPLGGRRPDLFAPDRGLLIEVKSGYARATRFTRRQIAKDQHLLGNDPRVTQVVWYLFRCGTKRLLAALEAAGITAIILDQGDIAGILDAAAAG